MMGFFRSCTQNNKNNKDVYKNNNTVSTPDVSNKQIMGKVIKVG